MINMQNTENIEWSWTWIPATGMSRGRDMAIFKNPEHDCNVIYNYRQISEMISHDEMTSVPVDVLKNAMNDLIYGKHTIELSIAS